MNGDDAEVEATGSGPLVWVAIIAATCLLLVVFQSTLWLVVPFLIALILYYLLQPVMQRLVFAGMGRNGAAAAVIAGFLVLVLLGAVLVLPWATTQAMAWQELVTRYVDGGTAFLKNSLWLIEKQFAWLQRAHLSENFALRIADLSENFAQRHLTTIVVTVAAWLPSLLLAPFLVFFFLRDGQRFKRFLGRAVPNAFFERSLYLLHEVDRTSRAYFRGLVYLTVIEGGLLALGLWLIGIAAPILLGMTAAVLAWIPYVGSILGGLLLVLVAATDFPDQSWVAYSTIALFLFVRMLDDFVIMPLTIGRSLRIHPLVAVVMIFVGGAVAGVAGLMLVLPLLGVVMVVGETVGKVVTDPRLRARHAHGRHLRARRADRDLA